MPLGPSTVRAWMPWSRPHRKLQDAFAKASLVDPGFLVDAVHASYLRRALGECDKAATSFEYGIHPVVCQVSLRFGAESRPWPGRKSSG